MKRLQILSVEESLRTPFQHKKPCSDCPWLKTSVPGWLGSLSPEEWIRSAHGEEMVECHTLRFGDEPETDHWQCAGIATYRANVCKSPRDKSILVLPPNRESVFSRPQEFLTHHGRRFEK